MEACCPDRLLSHSLYSSSSLSSLVLPVPLSHPPISAGPRRPLSSPLPFFCFCSAVSCSTSCSSSLPPPPSRSQSRSRSLRLLTPPRSSSRSRRTPQKRLLRSCQAPPKVYHRSRLKHHRPVASSIPSHRSRLISRNLQPPKERFPTRSFVEGGRRLHFDRVFPDDEARSRILHRTAL